MAARPRKLDGWDVMVARMMMIADAEGKTAPIAYASEWHGARRRRRTEDVSQDPPASPSDDDMVDLLAAGPLGGPETPEEEAAADRALEVAGARRVRQWKRAVSGQSVNWEES